MSMTARSASGAFPARRPRVPASSRRLAWISVILGLISLDLDALALLSPVAPIAQMRWYADLLLSYGPTAVVTMAMLALGVPLALIGLFCAGATARRGRIPLATLLGVALCSIGVAVPLCYAAFVYTFLRGLI